MISLLPAPHVFSERRKYAAPYEIYWKPAKDRTPPLEDDDAILVTGAAGSSGSHHVKHHTKHHTKHHVKHHAKHHAAAATPAAATPATSYQQYYEQYLPKGALANGAVPIDPADAAAADADAAPAAASTESLSEQSNVPSDYMSQYMLSLIHI